MIKIYRKTATIKAEQFDESQKMIKKYGIEDSAESGYNDSDWEDEGLCIPTKEGYLRINNGDWVATGIDGEHWPIADDVFRKTYAELPAVPKEVAEYLEMCKQTDVSLYYAIHGIEFNMSDPWSPVINWMAQHTEDFARAWLDGYQIGEEDE